MAHVFAVSNGSGVWNATTVSAVCNGSGVSNSGVWNASTVSVVSNAINVSSLELDEGVVFTSVCMVHGVSVCLSVCLSVCTYVCMATLLWLSLLWLSRRTPSPPCGVGIRNERGRSTGPGSACARFTCLGFRVRVYLFRV